MLPGSIGEGNHVMADSMQCSQSCSSGPAPNPFFISVYIMAHCTCPPPLLLSSSPLPHLLPSFLPPVHNPNHFSLTVYPYRPVTITTHDVDKRGPAERMEGRSKVCVSSPLSPPKDVPVVRTHYLLLFCGSIDPVPPPPPWITRKRSAITPP